MGLHYLKKRIPPLCILLVAAFFFVPGSYSQQKAVRVAVMPFYDGESKSIKSSASETMASQLSTALFKYSFIRLSERSRLNELISESKMAQLGIIDESSASRLGRVQGVDIMIFGSIDRGSITARAVVMETQRIIATSTMKPGSDIGLLSAGIARGIEVHCMKESLKSMRNDSPYIDFSFWVENISNGPPVAVSGKDGKLKIGDRVQFRFHSNSGGYLTIIDIQPGGDVIVLFPNDGTPDNRIKADTIYTIPSTDAPYEITVQEPAGYDTLVAFFTKKPVQWLDRRFLTGQGFRSVNKNDVGTVIRGFEIKKTGLSPAEWESFAIDIQITR